MYADNTVGTSQCCPEYIFITGEEK